MSAGPEFSAMNPLRADESLDRLARTVMGHPSVNDDSGAAPRFARA